MMQLKFSVQGLGMAVVVNPRPVTAEAQVRPQASACEICSGRIGIGTGTFPSISVLPCGYHYINGLHLHVAVTRRPNGRSLGISEQSCVL